MELEGSREVQGFEPKPRCRGESPHFARRIPPPEHCSPTNGQWRTGRRERGGLGCTPSFGLPGSGAGASPPSALDSSLEDTDGKIDDLDLRLLKCIQDAAAHLSSLAEL